VHVIGIELDQLTVSEISGKLSATERLKILAISEEQITKIASRRETTASSPATVVLARFISAASGILLLVGQEDGRA